jgi:hypothetical protein
VFGEGLRRQIPGWIPSAAALSNNRYEDYWVPYTPRAENYLSRLQPAPTPNIKLP